MNKTAISYADLTCGSWGGDDLPHHRRSRRCPPSHPASPPQALRPWRSQDRARHHGRAPRSTPARTPSASGWRRGWWPGECRRCSRKETP